MGGHEVNWLLDTNVWLRGYGEPETLPDEIQSLLGARDAELGLAAISLWEIGKKNQIGKLELKKELGAWLKDALELHIHLLPLTVEIVTDAMRLPDFPTRDPADELIVATARVHNLTLLTSDAKFKNYRHARIRWFKTVAPKTLND
jgi:PIN domain nuclease of toxin-antitoxin system